LDQKEKFIASVNEGYEFKGETITLGGAIFKGENLPGIHVKLPLKTMNRHGLIAGATGTGKTKTLQLITEGLSSKSVSVLLMDIKGDLSGLAQPGEINDKINERHEKIGMTYTPSSFPVELLSISNEKGARLRATVTEFGPVLFSKILDLNDTQSGVVSVLFKYSDEKKLPILDIKDFKKLLQFISDEGKDEVEKEYGQISTATIGTILRKLIELENETNLFFGERSFEVDDLVKIDSEGRGKVSIIRLADIQNKPKLFSTFLLCLLVEIYNNFPEEGDLDQPKLVIFIDEAHLLFQEASKALHEQINTIIKLIRSKGVGIFFCTQNPTDIPDEVLSQLGMKVQHSLRAFTAKDRKDIKMISENYPISEYYDVDELLTSMGIGEAAVTVLSEKGNPTPLVATLLCAPASRMDILSDAEQEEIISKSELVKKYNEVIDRESAYEILEKKLNDAAAESTVEETKKSSAKEEKSTVEKVLESTAVRQVGRTIAREVTRSFLGVLGIGGSSRKKKSSWF